MSNKLSFPPYWEGAVKYLTEHDQILRKLIPQIKDLVWHPSDSALVTLIRSIIGQQVSMKTADSIWQKFKAIYGSRPSYNAVLNMGSETLVSAGIGKRKAGYILDLAEHFDKKKVEPTKWPKMSDDEIVEQLTNIRGIGRWTAEMFLIFYLHRPNILPIDDLGLQKAISKYYFSGEPVSRYEMREVAQPWQPWCTVATMYLWQSLKVADQLEN